MLQIFYFLQLPMGSRNPDDNNPIDITDPFDLIMYIILPILLLIFYLLWKRNKKNDRDSDAS